MALKENIRTIQVTRYITPLREGGSLPALSEGCDGFEYVIKFKGSGHGSKALVSEFLGGEIARHLGLPVPEIVFANLAPEFGITEADEEIQDLLKFSQGLNLGLHFLSGAINYDPAVLTISEELASKVVWLDAFITNIDRTFRNTNMLIWHKKELWLIDHGASFFFQHTWTNWEQNAKSSFPQVKDHVLLPQASKLDEVNEEFSKLMTKEAIENIVDALPDEWLDWAIDGETTGDLRQVYKDFMLLRLNNSQTFINEAKNARQALI